ncbi:unnamed protein product [Nezara viridula]|uniref:Mab-21-like nucleotidyltransferase domain-containing protein n=1 Tax=Nezara viridula TaxID=85310 RepID=A0A9P0H6Q9_NEZVI|nr:unnamed protein product [Nezara viridula]
MPVHRWLNTDPQVTVNLVHQDSAQQWLQTNISEFISVSDWPPESPDLNPLGYRLSSELERMACHRPHPNLESLKQSLVRAVEHFLEEVMRSAIAMGCAASRRSNCRKDLKLPGANLTFSQSQLASLNTYLAGLVDNTDSYIREPSVERSLVIIERLIQRLICGVGVLDSRFASKFLVNFEPHKLGKKPGTSLSYLVRLDELSFPQLYPEDEGTTCHLVEPEGGPQGFGRLRLSGPGAERWAEFIGSHGYLRRDKVQERFVELLAQSAAKSGLANSPSELDDSRICAAPGKIVDASHLHYILQLPPGRQVFYGTGESQKKFPDPRDFRIAIVEGCSCVRLRVDMAYAGNVGVETDIEVTLVLGIGFSSWPSSAQFPARISLCHSECLLYHQAASTGFYAVPAPPHPTLRCEDRGTAWQLRAPAAEQTLLKHHSAQSVPSRTLAILRALLHEIRSTSSGGHVMLNSPGGGTLHYTEEDYSHDAELLTYTLIRLGEITAPDLVPEEREPRRRMEAALVSKWESLLVSLAPPPATRGVRFSFYPLSSAGYSTVAASQYSVRQLNYIGLLLRSMLVVRSLTLSKNNILTSCFEEKIKYDGSSEDLIYLVSSILEQAKHAYFRTAGVKKSLSAPYDQSAAQLLEEIRKSGTHVDTSDDNAVVREVLKWLYFGLDRQKKRLGPVLRPYLNNLFSASHENSWFAPEWLRRQSTEELGALGEFAHLVITGKIPANEGILDAENKDPLELVFTPGPGKVVRLTANGTQLAARSLTKSRGKATLPRKLPPLRECLKTRLQRNTDDDELLTNSHSILRNTSPLSLALEEMHRYGTQRGLGSIVQALLSLRKFSILQEVCCLLPDEERCRALEEIEGVRRARPRRAATVRGPPQPGSLMGTCRALRARNHVSVFNPAFFSSPETEAVSPLYNKNNNRGLSSEMSHIDRNTRIWHHRRSDITTQL